MMTGSLEDEIRDHLARALGTVCTAAACLVERRGEITARVGMGDTDPEADGRSVTVNTPFDLASLTKLFTGAAWPGSFDLRRRTHPSTLFRRPLLATTALPAHRSGTTHGAP